MSLSPIQQAINLATLKPCTAHTDKILQQLKTCRTAAMGYHSLICSNDSCAKTKYIYHSCRNRHCPQCGYFQQLQWIDDRIRELLPVSYYHVVFTVPHQLNTYFLANRKLLFNLLFTATSNTILTFAKNQQFTPGILAILHTWGQQLSFHPHIHCIVTGGGIHSQHKPVAWKNAPRQNHGFLFSTKAMAEVFRASFLKQLQLLHRNNKIIADQHFQNIVDNCYQLNWNVYAKEPFAGPQQVVNYLAAYTHKVAISNKRITEVNQTNKTVTFNYKDYADNSQQKQCTLTCNEFVRRLEMHILPKYFCKIRSYGVWANRNRTQTLENIKAALELPPTPPKVIVPWYIRLITKFGIQHNQCPHCKQITLIPIQAIESG
jgi:hypothetical protein